MSQTRLYTDSIPDASSCLRCRRLLAWIDREKYSNPAAEPEFCRWCACPMSDAARSLREAPGVATRDEVGVG